MGTSGTPRRVTIDGTVYNVSADADFNQKPDSTIEALASSGDAMYQVTAQNAMTESVTLSVDDAAYSNLEAAHNKGKLESFPMSKTLASGSVYRTTGRINLEGRTTSNNVATVSLMPDVEWSEFLA